MRPAVRAAAALAAAAAAGCSTPMAKLEGERGHTEWVTGAAGASVELPATFVLRNRTLGSVRVESVRVPLGTECGTVPPLPASIGPGRTLEVAVIGRFRRDAGDGAVRVLLESAGQEPLPLTLEARFQPSAPSGPASPEPIAAPAAPVSAPRSAPPG